RDAQGAWRSRVSEIMHASRSVAMVAMNRPEFNHPVVFFRIMTAHARTPILDVSDIAASFVWFEKWGWKKLWDWGTPPRFGAAGSGAGEIFLCQGGQGGRGRGENTTTFQNDGDEEGGKGGRRSGWGEDVDDVH